MSKQRRKINELSMKIMKTLIKNGRIVTAVDDYRADLSIEDEQI